MPDRALRARIILAAIALASVPLVIPSRVAASTPAPHATAPVGTWTLLPPPSVREAGVAFDRARNRLIVFGGYDENAVSNEVWTLDLGGSAAWTHVTTTGTPPVARHGHSTVFDPVHDKLWVFGGTAAGDVTLGDVWTLSFGGPTPAWTQLTPAGPAPSSRTFAPAVLDTANGRVLLFGGAHTAASNGPPADFTNDLWSMSLSGVPAWTAITPSGSAPGARAGTQMIWDGAAQRLVLFGGFDGNFLSDAYAVSLSGSPAWSTLSPVGGPPTGRAVGGAAWDPQGQRMIVYGGYANASGGQLTDVWQLGLAGGTTWTQLSPAGGPPAAREAPGVAWDSHTRSLVLYGGGNSNGQSVTDIAWRLNLAGSPQWTQLGTGAIGPRYGVPAIFDPVRHRLVTFGGVIQQNGPETYANDVWTYDLAGNWSLLSATGTPPSPRARGAAVYDPVRDRMVVYGGDDVANTFGDVYALSLSGTPAWTHIITGGGSPPARSGHAMVYDATRDRIVVYGGNGPGDMTEAWALDFGTNTWTPAASGSPLRPGSRMNMAAVYDPVNDRMVLFGGANDDAVWALPFSGTVAWTQLAPGGTPPAGRFGMAAAYDAAAHSMVVFGGMDGQWIAPNNSTAMLHLVGTPQWTTLDVGTDVPAARESPMAAFDQATETLYIHGGCCQNTSDTWKVTLDLTTPLAASAIDAAVHAGRVEVRWFVPGAATVTIERNDRGGWRAVASGAPDASGVLAYRDADVEAGGRYGYRVLAGGTPMGEMWVDVPRAAATLALAGFRPNPARGGTAVAFTLPADGPARLDVVDVTGRSVFTREVGSLGAGDHILRVGDLAAGVYVIRLSQAGRTVSGKVALLAR